MSKFAVQIEKTISAWVSVYAETWNEAVEFANSVGSDCNVVESSVHRVVDTRYIMKEMRDMKRLKHGSDDLFNAISIGPFRLSAQGSYTHYSSPRLTLDNASDYDSLELALFDHNGWINPRKDPRFHGLRAVDRWEEWDSKYSVAAYVPLDEVQEVIVRLKMLAYWPRR